LLPPRYFYYARASVLALRRFDATEIVGKLLHFYAVHAEFVALDVERVVLFITRSWPLLKGVANVVKVTADRLKILLVEEGIQKCGDRAGSAIAVHCVLFQRSLNLLDIKLSRCFLKGRHFGITACVTCYNTVRARQPEIVLSVTHTVSVAQ
jgi:hypothetical protein